MNWKHILAIVGGALIISFLLHLVTSKEVVVKSTFNIDSAIAPLHRDNQQLLKQNDSLAYLLKISKAMTAELKKSTWLSKAKLSEIQRKYEGQINHITPAADYDSFLAKRYRY